MAAGPSAVLIVDDDRDHLEIAALVLRALSPALPLRVARDAASAVAELADLPRGAVVLVDRVLGGVESFETVTRMHALRPDVTVVMMSAALSSIDRAYAIACGAREAVEKPGTLGGWREVLGALLGMDDARAAARRAA